MIFELGFTVASAVYTATGSMAVAIAAMTATYAAEVAAVAGLYDIGRKVYHGLTEMGITQGASPLTLTDMDFTMNQEGSVVPVVYGTVKVGCNLLWYGNLLTKEIQQTMPGGKGAVGEQTISVGYDYYLDVWFALCCGQVSLVSIYENETNVGISDIVSPTTAGDYATDITIDVFAAYCGMDGDQFLQKRHGGLYPFNHTSTGWADFLSAIGKTKYEFFTLSNDVARSAYDKCCRLTRIGVANSNGYLFEDIAAYLTAPYTDPPWSMEEVQDEFDCTSSEIFWYSGYTLDEYIADTGDSMEDILEDMGISLHDYLYNVDRFEYTPSREQIATVTDIQRDIFFNNGAMMFSPSTALVGEYASSLPGIAHLYMSHTFMGRNTSTVPNYSFVVHRELGIGMANGVQLATSLIDIPCTCPLLDDEYNPILDDEGNPTYATYYAANAAAIILDIITNRFFGACVAYTDINLTTFESAANYFKIKGVGLCAVFASQTTAEQAVKKIEDLADCLLYEDEDGKFALKAFDTNDAINLDLTDDDYIDFELSRPTWEETYNDFRANYTEPGKEWTVRTLQCRNTANIVMTGSIRTISIDLTAFIDKIKAETRLNEIMKRSSYPYATVRMTLKRNAYFLKPGYVVRITNLEHGLEYSKFRVLTVDVSNIEANKITISAVQMLETMFDTNYLPGGSPLWTPVAYSPVALTHQQIYELPYLEGEPPVYLVLAARKTGHETGFAVMMSSSGTDYTSFKSMNLFSQYGILDTILASSGDQYDAIHTIQYTPDYDDITFPNIPYSDLAKSPRAILIDNEIIAFEEYTPFGASSYKITKLLRGLYNTTITAHAIGAPIWIFYTNGIAIQPPLADFYVKLLPYNERRMLNLQDAVAIHVTSANVTDVPYSWELPGNCSFLDLEEDAYIDTGGIYIPTVTLEYVKPLVSTLWAYARIQIKINSEVTWREYGQDYSGGLGFTIDGARGRFQVGDTLYVRVISVTTNGVCSAEATSPVATILVDGRIDAPAPISGLELENATLESPYTWDGFKFAVKWRAGSQDGGFGELLGQEPLGVGNTPADPNWLHDEVEIWCGGIKRHSVTTTACRYEYVLGDALDAFLDTWVITASGTVTIKVRRWNKFNQASVWTQITVYNASPSTPDITITPWFRGIKMECEAPSESDFHHFLYQYKVGAGVWSDWAQLMSSFFIYQLTDAEVDLYGTDVEIQMNVKAIDIYGNDSDTANGLANSNALNIQPTDINNFAITASKIFTKIPILEADEWVNNSTTSPIPTYSAGKVAWNEHKLYYNGEEKTIAAGYSSYKYIYWTGASSYASSNTNPTLTDGQFIIATNISGTHDLAWNAIANQVIGTAYIQDLAVNDAKISTLSVGKLTAGTIDVEITTTNILNIRSGGVISIGTGGSIQFLGYDHNDMASAITLADNVAYGGGTTYIDGNQIYTGTVTLSKINGASGYVDITVASGIRIRGGGDLYIYGTDTDPAEIIFGGSTSNFIIGAQQSEANKVYFYSSVDNRTQLLFGWSPSGNRRFSAISMQTYGALTLTSYSSRYSQIIIQPTYIKLAVTDPGVAESYLMLLDNGTKGILEAHPDSYIALGSATYSFLELYVCGILAVHGDLYHMDQLDDLAIINAIKPSGKTDPNTGHALIDDDTLHDSLIAKVNGQKEYSPNGKPFVTMQALVSLLLGAVRQLDKKVEDMKNENKTDL